MPSVTIIGDLAVNRLPSVGEIEHFFTDYDEDEWGIGGRSGASFTIYGVEGTEKEAPFSDRIDANLAVYDDPDLGMYLYYSKTGGKYSEHYFSLGDTSMFGEFVENCDGDLLSKGLFVSPETAWLAVKDFIEREGIRSEKIRWAKDNELPQEAFATLNP